MDAEALLARMDRLEGRLALVERRLGAAPEAAPSPVAPPRASPPRPAPEPFPAAAARRAGRRTASNRDFERVVGVAVLGRVGVAALLLAAAYFARLAYDAFPPLLRVVSVYALAGVLIGVGAWLRPRVARPYVAILWGGGVAAAYLAGAVAKLRYDLVAPPVAIALLAASCALGQALAKVARLQVLAVVALLGAFAAPVLVGSPEDARTVLLVYLVALYAWGAWTEERWKWAGARTAGAAGMLTVAALWLEAHGRVDVSTYLHAHAYLAALVAPEAVRALKDRARTTRTRTALLLSVVGLAEAWAVLSTGTDLRWFAAIAGASWLGLGVAIRERTGEPGVFARALATLGGLLLALGAFAAWRSGAGNFSQDARPETFASLAVVGLASVLAARRLGAGEGAAILSSLLSLAMLATRSRAGDPWTLVALVAPLAVAFLGRGAARRTVGLWLAVATCFLGLAGSPVDPAGLAVAFYAAAAIVVAARLVPGPNGKAFPALPADLAVLALVATWLSCAFRGPFEAVIPPVANPGTFAAIAVGAAIALRGLGRRDRARGPDLRSLSSLALTVLAALAGWREVHAALEPVASQDLRGALESVYATLCAAIALAVGFRRKAPALRYVGLVGFGGVVLKVGLHDLASVDTPYRILVTGVLGGVLLAAAYAYARRGRGVDEEPRPV
jgi:hypothetical protein